MRECGLLHETNPSPSSPRLEVSLYDDYKSSLPSKSDFMVALSLTTLEEVIDPHLTSLPFVAPSLSSTPRDTTVVILHLLSSPIPSAQCMGPEMGKSFRDDARCVGDDLLDW